MAGVDLVDGDQMVLPFLSLRANATILQLVWLRAAGATIDVLADEVVDEVARDEMTSSVQLKLGQFEQVRCLLEILLAYNLLIRIDNMVVLKLHLLVQNDKLLD